MRIFKGPRKRRFSRKPVLWVVANNFSQCAEDRLPDKLSRVLQALLVEDNHVVEHRFDVALVTTASGARFHRHLERSLLEGETAIACANLFSFTSGNSFSSRLNANVGALA